MASNSKKEYIICRFNADGSTSFLGFGKRWHAEYPEAQKFPSSAAALKYARANVPQHEQARVHVDAFEAD